MFIDEVQKLSADVCLNVYAVGRVEPNYVSLLVLAAVLCDVSCRFLAFSEHSLFVVSALFECTFVVWSRLVEEFFQSINSFYCDSSCGDIQDG